MIRGINTSLLPKLEKEYFLNERQIRLKNVLKRGVKLGVIMRQNLVMLNCRNIGN